MAGYIDGPVPAIEVLAEDKGPYEGRLAVVGSSITPAVPSRAVSVPSISLSNIMRHNLQAPTCHR